jgi:putative ABC transport system permease protein
MAVTRLISGLLFGVSRLDPVTLVLSPLVLLTVAMAASYLPARRAMKVDPITALRSE